MYEKYQAESQYYGRQGLDMGSMCQGLIRAYELATKRIWKWQPLIGKWVQKLNNI